MKKYYNFETMFRSLKDEMTAFLKTAGIYYEISSLAPFAGWHFEILASEKEAQDINDWLDTRTITEVR